MKPISRRDFIKTSAVAGAAVCATPTLLIPESEAAWHRGTRIHPHVDNLRVVGVTDPKMTKAIEPVSSWAQQEALVDEAIVWENIDKLACALTRERNPAKAWQAIFVKPPGKSWSETSVAIKTNHIARQHTRSAVMSKVCHSLIDFLGVKGRNIHIYDGCHGKGMSRDTPFSGLTADCRIENQWQGITTPTRIPKPWNSGQGSADCLEHLVRGSVDILVNISMCKGHSHQYGGFTMTMKNHLGTFSPRPIHQGGGLDYLIAINKTSEILGPFDKRSGQVIYPRQQLCIVDALWASKKGPGCMPSHQPNFLAMGVFAPAVDYQIATQFRHKEMGWKPNREALERILKEFGIHKGDFPEDGRLIRA